MKRKLPTAALVILAAGSATAFGAFVGQGEAHETARAAAEGLRCAVVTRDLGDTVQISGKVTSERDVAGTYALSIRQTSGGGQAVIEQGGEFTVAAGRTVTRAMRARPPLPMQMRAVLRSRPRRRRRAATLQPGPT